MTAQVFYLLGIVATGWAVTVGLRALPFILFSGSDRQLPTWVERFGIIISPVIIFGLIVYSYSQLEWLTPWPYLAGLLTIALHLCLKNSLVAIISGTALYMVLLSGCVSQASVQLDSRDPSIHYSDTAISIDNLVVTPQQVVEILADNDIPKDRVIHIRVAQDTKDLSGARALIWHLARAGYPRAVLVTERHSDAYTTEKKKKETPVSNTKKSTSSKSKKIRYKKANE